MSGSRSPGVSPRGRGNHRDPRVCLDPNSAFQVAGDRYFDDGQAAREFADEYHDDAQRNRGEYMDPFTYGIQEAGKDLSCPREYFLTVVNAWSAQVTREWKDIVSTVKKSVRLFTQTSNCSLTWVNRSPSGEDEDLEKVRTSRDWIVRTRRLSRELLSCLSRSVDACEEFLPRCGHYFYGLPRTNHVLSDIQQSFVELEMLKTTLDSLVNQCGGFARDLELRLIIDSTAVSSSTPQIQDEVATANHASFCISSNSFKSDSGTGWYLSLLNVSRHWRIILTLGGQKPRNKRQKVFTGDPTTPITEYTTAISS